MRELSCRPLSGKVLVPPNEVQESPLSENRTVSMPARRGPRLTLAVEGCGGLTCWGNMANLVDLMLVGMGISIVLRFLFAAIPSEIVAGGFGTGFASCPLAPPTLLISHTRPRVLLPYAKVGRAFFVGCQSDC